MGFAFKRPMKTVQESKGTQLCHKDNFECVASYLRGTQGKPVCSWSKLGKLYSSQEGNNSQYLLAMKSSHIREKENLPGSLSRKPLRIMDKAVSLREEMQSK